MKQLYRELEQCHHSCAFLFFNLSFFFFSLSLWYSSRWCIKILFFFGNKVSVSRLGDFLSLQRLNENHPQKEDFKNKPTRCARGLASGLDLSLSLSLSTREGEDSSRAPPKVRARAQNKGISVPVIIFQWIGRLGCFETLNPKPLCKHPHEIIYKKLSATALFRDSHYFIGEKRRAPFPLSGGVKKEKQKFKRSRTLCARINFIHLVKRNNNEDYTWW